MSQNSDTGGWRTTRDHEEIREWARRNDAVPVEERSEETAVDLEPKPAGDRVAWGRFFDVFDRDGLALRYREGGERGSDVAARDPDFEIVDRDDLDRGGEPSDQTHEPRSVDANQRALSDTGDAEPVVYDRAESESDAETTEASTAPIGDKVAASSAAAEALVLDAVHEHRPGMGDSQDEHVTFENEGDQSLDLSGWRVRNGAGQTYRFPEGTTIGPGELVRVHSGTPRDDRGLDAVDPDEAVDGQRPPEAESTDDYGPRDGSDVDPPPTDRDGGDTGRDGGDTDHDLYWDAGETVWRTRGDTIIVETPNGEPVLEQDYKGGRSEPG